MHKKGKDLERVIRTIEQIPTLPIISQITMEIAEDESAPMEALAEVVENDQALASKILKIVNSASYGLVGKVSSIGPALVILGTKEVKSIVLGVSVYKFFSSHGTDVLDPKQFWRHSIICGQAAKLLGTRFDRSKDDTLFVAGLVHDIGKIVLEQYFHEEFIQIIDCVSSNNATFGKTEKNILGTTHYQIGAKLLQQWNFPKKIIMEVLYHHAPWSDQNYSTSSIMIYLANIFSKLAGYPFHSLEKKMEPHEFAKSPELEFAVKSGVDLDYESIVNLTSHIEEIACKEVGELMKVLED